MLFVLSRVEKKQRSPDLESNRKIWQKLKQAWLDACFFSSSSLLLPPLPLLASLCFKAFSPSKASEGISTGPSACHQWFLVGFGGTSVGSRNRIHSGASHYLRFDGLRLWWCFFLLFLNIFSASSLPHSDPVLRDLVVHVLPAAEEKMDRTPGKKVNDFVWSTDPQPSEFWSVFAPLLYAGDPLP